MLPVFVVPVFVLPVFVVPVEAREARQSVLPVRASRRSGSTWAPAQ